MPHRCRVIPIRAAGSLPPQGRLEARHSINGLTLREKRVLELVLHAQRLVEDAA